MPLHRIWSESPIVVLLGSLSVRVVQLLLVHHDVEVLTDFLHALVGSPSQHCFDVELSMLIPEGVLGLHDFIP